MVTPDVAKPRRRVRATIALCATLLAPRTMHAASAITPPISATSSTIVCTAANLNATPPQTAVTLNIRNVGGILKQTASYNLDNADVAVLEHAAGTAGDHYYCEAVASTNGQVDNLRVGQYLVNATTGNPQSAVKGRRVGTSAISQVTLALEKSSPSGFFRCLALTTADQPQLTFTLYDEFGTQVRTLTVSNVAAGTVAGVEGQSADASLEYCEVRATSSTNGNKLRAIITVLDSDADSITSAEAE
jgi:hypothetical protein